MAFDRYQKVQVYGHTGTLINSSDVVDKLTSSQIDLVCQGWYSVLLDDGRVVVLAPATIRSL